MGSFSTSLSGLDAEEQALSVISNDLSNLNTTAFKTGTPVFSDLFYQMLGTDGAGDPVQVGVGTTMSSVDSPFTQGDVSSTGVPTDVAIQGNGLFIVDQNGTQVYTRAGNFTLSCAGNLIDSNGNDVLGYAAVNGTINTNGTLSPIVISSGETFPPSATSTVELDMNLDAADTSLAPATGTLTVPPPTLPTAGQTVNIGGTVYTFATALTPQSGADTVQIGADIQSTLANLAAAINATPAGAGNAYSSATVLANPSVTATANATTLSLQAINTGVAGNSLASSAAWTAGSFGAADLTGGVNDQQATGTLSVPPPVPTAGETITLGGTTYTFATALTPQSGADVVLIDPTSVQNTLANLAAAINLGAGSGTAYSSATVAANATVTATGSTTTQITLQALNAGLAGNSDVTSTNWANGNFNGAADLGGGADAVAATATFTVPSVTLPNLGDTVAIGGTTYTFVQNAAALVAPDEVVRGVDIQSTLTNLMNAINADPSNEGVTFTSGTTANSMVSASNPTAASLTLTARTAGSAGDSGASYTTATSWTGGAFGVDHLSGGTTGVAASATFTAPASDPTDGNTVTIGGTTYTFVANAGELATPEDVLIAAGDIPTTVANLAAAITADSTSVTVTGSTGSTITLQAANSGLGGNSLGVSTSWNGALFAGGGLAGGVDAVAAVGTFNVPLLLPAAGQTVSVGGVIYTFQDSPVANEAANTVAIGPDVQTTMENLMAAINLGTGSGTAYSTATVAKNSFVTASNPTATSLTLTATAIGTAGNNSVATLTNWSGGSFGASDLTGGVDAVAATGAYTVPISLPSVGQTVTVGGTTYTFVATAQDLTAPDEVLRGPDVGTTLSNLADAINATPAGAGITYATGTVANSSVTATGSTATSLSLEAIPSGSTGDSLATTTTWSAAAFGSADLTGSTDAGTYSDSIPVYDSLGNGHVLTFNFTKTSSGDWTYQITIPGADLGSTGAPQVVASGTLQFDSSGNLVSPSANVAGTISNLADGASALDFNWTLFNSSGAPVITQTAETSATSSKNANGYSAGTLQSYSIGSDGVIDGVLSNDQTVSLGQIALATFPNYDGLTNLGSNDYQASLASGAATVGTPGSGGRGTLEGTSLEASNVDIATAFTELIQAERGYEANAKAITTADDVMQASIALIQS